MNHPPIFLSSRDFDCVFGWNFLVDFVLFGFFLEEETLCWATEFQ
jgi:hypothetical protein